MEIEDVKKVMESKQLVRHNDIKYIVTAYILRFYDNKFKQLVELKDERNTDIYEGDIVKANNEYIGIVKYGEFYIDKMISEQSVEAAELLTCTSAYGFYIAFQDGTDYLFDNNTEDWLKVIGNIYENPELLEVGDE